MITAKEALELSSTYIDRQNLAYLKEIEDIIIDYAKVGGLYTCEVVKPRAVLLEMLINLGYDIFDRGETIIISWAKA